MRWNLKEAGCEEHTNSRANRWSDEQKRPNVNCRMRNIPEPEIQVTTEQETKKFFMKKGESLMDALLREGVYLSAPCGGNGRCGKCGVQVLKGKAPVTGEDEKSFSEKELEQG